MNVVIWFDELNLGKGVLRDMSHLVSRLPSHIAICDGAGGEMEWRVDEGDGFVTVIDCPQSSGKSSVTGSVKTVDKTVDKKPDGTTNDRILDLLAP